MQIISKARVAAREERGQATLEFALVIVFLLAIVFGIVDFSRLFFAYATMSNGVREGARYGIVNPGQDAAIIDRARAMMVVIGGNAAITVTYPDDDPDPNIRDPYCSHYCRVVVRAESQLDVWTPILPAVTVVTRSTMHIE
jgi:TadE-like protein